MEEGQAVATGALLAVVESVPKRVRISVIASTKHWKEA
jgi:hypothetical protein